MLALIREKLVLYILGILLGISTTTLAQTTYTWNNLLSGNWTDASNWLPNGVPGTGDFVVLTEGTVVLDSNLSVCTLEMVTNSILSGSGAITITDTLNWFGGDMIGNGTTILPDSAIANVNNNTTIDLDVRTFENYGTVLWDGTGKWKFKNYALFNNYLGAVFDIQRDGVFDYVLEDSGGSFINYGSVKKTADDGDRLEFDITFTNASTGTVQASSGNLRFERGSTTASKGSFIVDSGAIIQIAERPFMLDGVTFSGGGTVEIVDRTNFQVVGSGITVASGTTLEMNTDDSGGEGFLEGDGDITINGTFDWTEGTLQGSGDLIINGTLQTVSGGTRILNGKTIENYGSAIFDQTFRMAGNSVFDNRVGGVVETRGPYQIVSVDPDGGSITNAGTWIRKTASGEAKVDVPFTNSGLIDIEMGELRFRDDITNEVTGIISGVDTLEVTGVTFLNNGIIRPGASPGQLVVLGNLQQGSTGQIDLEVGGTTPGSNFDQLLVSGSVQLDGILNLSLINSFEPAATDTFPVISYASSSGSFFSINNASLNGNGVFKVNYDSDSLRLSVDSIPRFALDVDTVGGGGVTLSPAGGEYDTATTVILTATADSGFTFSSWSGDLTSAGNPDTLVMNEAKSVTATFLELPDFNVVANVVGSGSITLDPPGGVYDSSSTITATANPAAGYYFTGWSGDLSGTDNPDTLLIDDNKTITANFATLPQFVLDVDTVGVGGVTLDPAGGTYDSTSTVTLTATPGAGYYFHSWSGDLASANNPDSIVINGNKNVTANFLELPDFQLTTTAVGGSIVLNPAGGTYDSTTTVVLSAVADSGYYFSHWTGDVNGESNPENLLMDGNKSVTAVFIPRFLLSMDSIGNGTVTVTPDSSGRIYDSLDVVSISATPASGYYFKQWSGDYSGTDNPASVEMNSDKSITAEFINLPDFVLDIDTVGSGGVSLSPAGGVYDSTTQVTLTATADPGYAFTGWSGDLASLENPVMITMDSPKNITATFEEVASLFTLDVDTVGNGGVTLSPTGPSFNSTVMVTLTATADPGYYFVGWSGDLVSANNPDSILVDANKNVTATFAELPDFTLTTNTSGPGNVSLSPSGGVYDSTTVVTLTATASDPDYKFSHWSGDLSSSSNPADLVMDGNKSVTANFVLEGESYEWNTVDGDWDIASNWTPNGIPGAQDTAWIKAQVVTLNTNKSVAMLKISNGGALSGDSTLTITDSLSWVSGDMNDSGKTVIAASARASISHGGNTIDLNARTLENYGTIVWEGTGVWKLKNKAFIINRQGGTFDVRRDGILDYVQDLTGGNFVNQGTLMKTSGSGRIEIDPTFYNDDTGVVWSRSGTLRFERGDSVEVSSGTFRADSGHIVQLSERQFMIDGATFSGDGVIDMVDRPNVQISGSGLTVDSDATFELNTDDSGGQGFLEGSGPINVNGTFLWTRGTVRGSGDLNIAGSLTTSSTSTKVLDGRPLNISGDMIVTSTIRVTGNAAITNLASGTIDFQNNVNFVNISPGGTITNTGLVTRTAGTGTAEIQLDFTNNGTVGSDAGILAFDELFDHNSGAAIQGSDTLDFTSASVSFDGDVNPGTSPGILVVSGGFNPSSSTTVNIEIGGTTVGSEYDRFVVPGTANLDGTLNISLINGYSPPAGETFTVFTAGTRNGQFATVNVPSSGGSDVFDVTYSGDDIILTSQLNPQFTVTLDTIGNGGITLNPDRSGYYRDEEVEATATADSGYRFLSWGGDLSGSDNPDTVIVDTNKTISASFIRQYKINTTIVSGGSIQFSPTAINGGFDSLSTVTLTAVPDSGYIFVGWSGDLSGSGLTDSLVMTQDYNVTATFQARFALATTTVGNGSVVLLPAGGVYDSSVVVTLTATPGAGYAFAGWSGDLSGSANPDSVTMDSDKNVTALFVPQYSVMLDTIGGGGLTLSPSGGIYDSSTTVVVTATADSGFAFANWSGDLSGNANPDSLIINSNKQITGRFIPTYTLTTVVDSGGVISLSPNNPGGVFDSATVVTLTATADSGFVFDSWSGNLSGTESIDSLTMNTDKSVTAVFTKLAELQFTVTIDTVGPGVITPSPNDTAYDGGTIVEYTATPDSGARFVGWSGDLSGTANPDSLTIDENKAITGTFIRQYLLTLNGDAGGAITTVPDTSGGAIYDSLTQIIFTATPDSGYRFASWSGDLSGTASPDSLIMDADRTVNGDFLRQYRLIVGEAQGGLVQLNPDTSAGGLYDSATVVQVTAIPDSGYTFLSWSGDLSSADSTDSLTMNGDKTITPQFFRRFTLAVDSTAGGGVTVSPNDTIFDINTVVTLTANPDSAYRFNAWSGDLSSTVSPDSVVMDGDKQVTANFLRQFSLALDNGTGGNISVSPDTVGGSLYDSLSRPVFTAIPDSGYRFLSWGGDLSGSANPDSLLITANSLVSASFIKQYKLTVVNAAGGSVQLNPDTSSSGTYDSATVVYATAMPDSGYIFLGWSGDLSGTDTTDSLTMDGDKSIAPQFLARFALTVDSTAGGSLTVSSSDTIFDSLAVVTFTATADSAYRFSGWSGDLSGSANPDSIVMNSDKQVTANFIRQFTLATSVAGDGSVSLDPSGGVYDSATVVTMTATPGPGRVFSGWSGDTTGTEAAIAIPMNSDKQFTASFAIPTAITFEEVETGTSSSSSSVTTSSALTAENDHLYIAAISTRSHVLVDTVTGLGLSWQSADEQCAGRSQTGVEVWYAVGTPSGNSTVTATLTGSSQNTVLAVSRYSGVDPAQPIGAIISGNTNGLDGSCSGGSDSDSYAFNITTSIDGAYVYSAVGIRNKTHTSPTAYTERAEVNKGGSLGSAATLAVQDREAETAGSILVNGGISDDVDWAMIGLEIRPQVVVNTYTLTASAGSGGSITQSPQDSTYDENTVVTLTAVADSAYRFVSWGGDLSGSANPDSITMDGNKTVSASFIRQFSLTTTVDSGGSITLSPSGGVYDSATVVTATAVPDSGYSFVGWSDALGGIVNPDSVQMDSNTVIGAIFQQNLPPVVNAKVWLEGPYNAGEMDTTLAANALLPVQQPFNTAPWNYTGDDSVVTMPTNVVDWVLVALRNTPTGSDTSRRAGLLKKDGTITDMDGSTLTFDGMTAGDYYVVIMHRNHLAIMSSNALSLSDSSSLYDFTTSQGTAYGSDPLTEVSAGVFGMYSGDGNADGGIDATDKNTVWRAQNATLWNYSKYSDFNLDGGVDVLDLNVGWRVNNGVSTQVPSGGMAKNSTTGGGKGKTSGSKSPPVGAILPTENRTR